MQPVPTCRRPGKLVALGTRGADRGGRTYRYVRAGRRAGTATTGDHALLGLAALTLFEVTGSDGYLADARAHAAEALVNWDDRGAGSIRLPPTRTRCCRR